MSKLNIKHNFISQNQNTKTIERVFLNLFKCIPLAKEILHKQQKIHPCSQSKTDVI